MSAAEKIGVYARSLGCKVIENAPMSEYTTFKTGGNAAVLAEPQNEEILSLLLKKCKEEGEKPFIIGNGSNLLVDDGGIDGVVIRIGEAFSEIKQLNETTVECGAGVSLSGSAVLPLKRASRALSSLSVYREAQAELFL